MSDLGLPGVPFGSGARVAVRALKPNFLHISPQVAGIGFPSVGLLEQKRVGVPYPLPQEGVRGITLRTIKGLDKEERSLGNSWMPCTLAPWSLLKLFGYDAYQVVKTSQGTEGKIQAETT